MVPEERLHLYFPDEDAARRAAARLQERGRPAEVQRGPDGQHWVVSTTDPGEDRQAADAD